MDVEHSVRVFQLGPNLEAELQAMTAEGWILSPGATPVAIYHVVRLKGAIQQGNGNTPVARIAIDDSKVKILRDGQLVDG
jgi:hypothetical protein